MADRYHISMIRHLPTVGNTQKRYIGWTDEPILDHSIIIQSLPSPTYLYGSDLVRAEQTAALYYPDVAYQSDERWRECNFGRFEGKTYAQLEEDKDYRNWIDNPYENAPPEGERLQEMEQRVVAALVSLPNGAVVVTHGGPIRVVLTKFSAEVQEFWSWDVPHGGGYRLEWTDAHAFKEGKPCISISAVPIMANGNL